MGGNIFIPDEIEQFAKKLPQLQAQVERILDLSEAFLVDANAALKDMRGDVTKLEQGIAKLKAAIKEAL